LRYYKGLQYLLAALPAIAGARLLVVGEGPMRPELERQIAALGLGERVILAGRVPAAQLPGCYRAADLFCLPASERSEAFGLVQVEAMSSGLPVISTELGTGTSYVNQHGESGWVVPPRDPAALAHAANALLADPAERQRLAEGALRRSEQFDAARMVAAVELAYRQVYAGMPASAPAAAICLAIGARVRCLPLCSQSEECDAQDRCTV
jgi:rhamnosyl/mannosyltransferase